MSLVAVVDLQFELRLHQLSNTLSTIASQRHCNVDGKAINFSTTQFESIISVRTSLSFPRYILRNILMITSAGPRTQRRAA